MQVQHIFGNSQIIKWISPQRRPYSNTTTYFYLDSQLTSVSLTTSSGEQGGLSPSSPSPQKKG